MKTLLGRRSTASRRGVIAATVCCFLLLSLIGCKVAANGKGGLQTRARPEPLLVAANGGTPAQSAAVVGDLLIRADFENATVVPPPNGRKQVDVLKLQFPSGAPADVGVFYEGGTVSDRYAQVVADPTGRNNRVLKFWLKDASVAGQRIGRSKGRIQMALANLGFTEAYQRYRIYLHPDLEHYRAFPKQNVWFTLNELWFGATWEDHPYPFRITLGLAKEAGAGRPLYFLATADSGVRRGGRDQWTEVWHSINRDFQVPVGEWMDVELGYRQGDSRTGRFYLAVKRQSDPALTTVMDVRDWTYNPQAREPVPLTHWNPLKLYTSGEIIDFIRKRGGVTQVYFDDLELRRAWPR